MIGGDSVSRHRGRAVVATLLLLGAAACGNSSGEDEDTSPDTTEAGSGSTTGGGGEGDRDTFVSISGVPGVTDDEIAYQVIGTQANNPLGTCILD